MKKRLPVICLAVFALLTGTSCGTQGNSFYVDPSSDPGGDGSPGHPYQTVQAAVDGIRAARASGSVRQGRPVELVFRSGDYMLGEGITLTADDSGTEDSPYIWRAEKGARVRLIGGTPVPAELFKKVEDPSVIAKLPEEARGKAYVADISGLVPEEIQQLKPSFSGIPVGPVIFTCDRIATLSRWPNGKFMEFDEVVDHGTEKGSFGAFVCKDPRPGRWDYESGVWLYGYWTHDWSNACGRAEGFGEEKGVKNVLRLASSVGTVKGGTWGRDPRRFFAFNLLEELDDPGEWYIDRSKKLLYMMPLNGEPSDADETVLSNMTGPLVKAEGIAFFKIQGLDFKYTYGNAVVLTGNDITVSDCTFSCIGQSALSIHGDRNLVSCSDFCQIGQRGIDISAGDRKTLTKGGSVVEDCHLHHTGIYFRCYYPAINVNGCGVTIRGNVIHDTPHHAIHYLGNEHLIEYNEIYNAVFETADAGAVSTGGDWTLQGNVLRYNYIHDDRSGMEHESNTMGFYFDDLDAGKIVYGNIFHNICMGIMVGGGRDHVITDNIFSHCETAITLDARGLRWPTYKSFDAGAALGLLQKARALDYDKGVWAEKYPHLARIMEEDPLVPLHNPIERNVFIDCTNFIIDLDTAAIPHLSKMSPIKDNVVINTYGSSDVADAVLDEHIRDGFTFVSGTPAEPFDAGFVDPANRNFTLKKDAWLLKQVPDFKPVPKRTGRPAGKR